MELVFDISLSPSPSIFTLLRWLPVACTSSCVWWMASHGGAWRGGKSMASGGLRQTDRSFRARPGGLLAIASLLIALALGPRSTFWKSCYVASWSRVAWTKALGLSGCNWDDG